MTKLTKMTPVPHGVIFLYDPTMIIDVPPDTSESAVLYTENCVTVWTIQETDGDVFLLLSDEEIDVSGQLVFDGTLTTDGRRLAFNDSSVNTIMELDVTSSRTRISIFTNDPQNPTAVACRIHP